MNCIFCKIIAGEIPCDKVFENERVIAFLDLHPCSFGHTLIVPRVHSETIVAASEEDRRALMDVLVPVSEMVLRAVGSHGFNTGINTHAVAGQVIAHTHVHIIPRFENDGLKHWTSKDVPIDELRALAEKIRAAK